MALDVKYLKGTPQQYAAYEAANKIVATNFYYISGNTYDEAAGTWTGTVVNRLYLGSVLLSEYESINALETALNALTARVDVLEDATSKHNADVLVGGSDVEEQSRCYGRGYQTDASTDEADKHIGNALQHACCFHGTTKAHGADDEPNGVEHAAHAACSNEFGQQFVVGAQ